MPVSLSAPNPVELFNGDCLAYLLFLEDNSIDTIVTDPPYGLSFMGKRWDYDVPSEAIWCECLRVLKPGGYLLAFAGTRTQHRMAVRIEDAGFEIRDMIAWVYGSGFPKSRNIAEMDMKGGAARQWQGWGTALKPALEPITVARKPLVGTVAENVLEHGTGAINVDGCRVAMSQEDREFILKTARPNTAGQTHVGDAMNRPAAPTVNVHDAGRWPANLIHDGSDEVLAAFPHAPGQQGRARTDGADQGNNTFGALKHITKSPDPRSDTGSAARFFYCAKASKSDRGAGNVHPTVKPTDLMRYLCRLVTPPGGTVFDPFMGSGSTGKAAVLEGFRFIGCEMSPEYMAIAQARIALEGPH